MYNGNSINQMQCGISNFVKNARLNELMKVMEICLTSIKPLAGENLANLTFEEKNKFIQILMRQIGWKRIIRISGIKRSLGKIDEALEYFVKLTLNDPVMK